MGTPNFALKSLESINQHFDVSLVVTQPDKPTGRKKEIIFSPVKTYCINRKVKFLQPEKIKDNKDFLFQINDIKPDIIVVAAYGKILPKEILSIPKIGCINIHASLLPQLRGAAPINRAIINGNKETGITLMEMDEGMDSGNIISTYKIEIQSTDTTISLTEKLADLGASQIVKLIKELGISPIINSKKQDHSKATIAPKMTKEDGLIDWEKSFNEINDLIRGCNPWPVAYTKLDKSMIKIYEVTQNNSEKIPPGVIKKVNGSMVVGCKDKNIEILHIQKSGQKKISGKDFINGISFKSHIKFI